MPLLGVNCISVFSKADPVISVEEYMFFCCRMSIKPVFTCTAVHIIYKKKKRYSILNNVISNNSR